MFYNNKNLTNRLVFSNTKLFYLDITFSINTKHVVLILKQSKTNTLYKGVNIILVAIGIATCLVLALYQL